MRYGLLSLLFGFLFASTASAQLESRLYLDKDNYLLGEPAYLHFDLTNKGTIPVEVAFGNGYSSCGGYMIEVSSDPSTEISSCSTLGSGGSCISGAWTIAPGQTRHDDVLLNYQHDLSKPAFYDITASRTLKYGPIGTSLRDLPQGLETKAEAQFHIRVVDGSDASLVSIFQKYLVDLDSKDEGRQREAARVIGTLAPSFMEDTILAMVDSNVTRPFALEGLRHLNTVRSREALAKIVQNTAGYSSDKERAIKFLSEMGDKKYFPLLLDEAQKEKPNQSRDYVLAAAQLGGEDTMPYVSSLLASADPFSLANGVMALPLTGSRRAVPILIDLLRSQNVDIGRLSSIGLIRLTHRSPLEVGRWYSDAPANEYPGWIRWWIFRGDSAPVYGPSQCGKIEPLN